MTQEQKNLLLKDLCSRLPYGVMAKFGDSNPSKITNIAHCIDSNSWFIESEGESDGMICPIDNVKPHLFPLSSITEEQKEELRGMEWSFDNSTICNIIECLGTYRAYVDHSCCFELVDWLDKNKFDYRGLIPMGLAEDATGKNIY